MQTTSGVDISSMVQQQLPDLPLTVRRLIAAKSSAFSSSSDFLAPTSLFFAIPSSQHCPIRVKREYFTTNSSASSIRSLDSTKVSRHGGTVSQTFFRACVWVVTYPLALKAQPQGGDAARSFRRLEASSNVDRRV